jgi:hypothetical protein
LLPPGFHRFHASASQFIQFFSSSGGGLWNVSRWSSRLAIGIFGAIAAWMTWRLRLTIFAGRRLLIWLWFVVACAAPTAVDLIRHTYISDVPRYAIAALPAAYILVAIGLAHFEKPVRLMALACILAVWLPPLKNLYQQHARNKEPFRTVAQIASIGSEPSDLVLVHSIPSGVLGIARYSEGSAPIASWIGQLGTRRLPASLNTLISGRNRISLIKLHEVRQPAPEEEWLRSNGQILQERRIGVASIVQLKSKNGASFD